MAWTSETKLGAGWTYYVKNSLANDGTTDAIDTRQATRVIAYSSGDFDAVPFQANTDPTASGAGSTFDDMEAETGLVTVADPWAILHTSAIPPYLRVKNTNAAGSSNNIYIFVKRPA